MSQVSHIMSGCGFSFMVLKNSFRHIQAITSCCIATNQEMLLPPLREPAQMRALLQLTPDFRLNPFHFYRNET